MKHAWEQKPHNTRCRQGWIVQFSNFHQTVPSSTNRICKRLLSGSSIKEKNFVSAGRLSESITILGVCNEIVGDKKAAYYCYETALQNEYYICPTAAKRKVNLHTKIYIKFINKLSIKPHNTRCRQGWIVQFSNFHQTVPSSTNRICKRLLQCCCYFLHFLV
jgi:hypothetical protein